jgi:hypothetical protein
MTKKISVLLLFVLISAVAVNAQEFKKFQLYTGLGYAMPGGEGAGGGFLWDVEPAYRVSDELAVGLRIEGALIVRGLSEASDTYSGDIAGISSYTLNGRYYFSNEKFRPYAGLGVGMYSLAAVSFSTTGGGSASESKIGFYPRVGFDLGHFNVNIDYNIVGTTEVNGFDSSGNPKTFDVKNSYLGIRIGAFFFGGRK